MIVSRKNIVRFASVFVYYLVETPVIINKNTTNNEKDNQFFRDAADSISPHPFVLIMLERKRPHPAERQRRQSIFGSHRLAWQDGKSDIRRYLLGGRACLHVRQHGTTLPEGHL